jgi:hypothetical protein
MVKQNSQLIAVVAQSADTTQPLDIQGILEKQLFQKYEFQRQRVQTALIYALMATVGVLIALTVFSTLNLLNMRRLPTTYNLFNTFAEWRDESPHAGCDWFCEFRTQSTRLINVAGDVGASIFFPSDQDGSIRGNIAGIARLCTLISVLFTVAFSYRKHLADYYRLNGQFAQLDDFTHLPRWQFWLTRILYTVAALYGTYVVVSILWLGLSFAFKDMALDLPNAVVVIVIFNLVVTFAATYAALAAATRDVLMLGLFTFAVGLLASFSLAPLLPPDNQQWWQSAVSNAGQFNPSAPLFTGTLLSGSLALIVLWFDIDSIIQAMINDGDLRWLSAQGWMTVARLLYTMLILGLLFVGFVRVDHNFPSNYIFHAGGSLLAIGSVIAAGILIRKQRFHPWYRIFSTYSLLGGTFAMAVLSTLRFVPTFGTVRWGTGLIGLTVIELTLFVAVGFWLYITVDNLLAQANINAFSGKVVALAVAENTVPTP